MILEGGTAASRSIAPWCSRATPSVLARLVKAQHEVNPAAGKTGDFWCSSSSRARPPASTWASGFPNLEAGALRRLNLRPKSQGRRAPDEWGDP